MTFPTDQKNTFKKDPLKGLEYDHVQYKPWPFVQVVFIMLLIMAALIAVKMCTDRRVVVTVEELNARSHD